MSSYRLSHVSVENFKSIQKADVEINRQAFYLISGPNGSGKTNFLEAISFGLGSSINRSGLRVDGAHELAGWGLAGAGAVADKRYQMKRTVVQLTFISCNSRVATGPPKAKKAKRQHCFGDPVLISSSLVGLMRHFYLNGTKVTKKKFQRMLAETIGLSKESRAWCITQNAVQDTITAKPKHLFNTLCDAAGTLVLREERQEAISQISKGRDVLRTVGTKISAMRSFVSHESELWEQYKDFEQLESEEVVLKACVDKLRDLTSYVHIYAYGVLYLNHWKNIRDKETELDQAIIDRQESKYGAIETDITSMKENIDLKLNKIEHLKARMDTLSQTILELTTSIATDEKSISVEMVALGELANRTATLKAKRSYICDTEIADCYSRLTVLESKCDGEKTDSHSLAKSNLESVGTELREVSSKEISIETQQMDILAKLTEAIEESEHCGRDYASSSSICNHQQNIINGAIKEFQSICADQNAIDQFDAHLWDSYCALADADRTRANTILENCVAAADASLKKMVVDLSVTQKLLAQNNSVLQLPQLISLPSEYEDGDYGFFVDVINFKAGINNDPAFSALQALLFPFLRIRLCRDNHAAARIVSYCTEHRTKVRIWPLDVLLLSEKGGTKNSAASSSALRCAIETFQLMVSDLHCNHGITAVNPVDLLSWSDEKVRNLSVAVVKALSGWLIVDDDNVASKLLDLKIKDLHGCITISGTRHIAGQLIPLRMSSENKRKSALSLMKRKSLISANQMIVSRIKDASAVALKLKEKLAFIHKSLQTFCQHDIMRGNALNRRTEATSDVLVLELERTQLSSMLEHCRRNKKRLQDDVLFWDNTVNCGPDNDLKHESLIFYNENQKSSIRKYLTVLENLLADLDRQIQLLEEVETPTKRDMIDMLTRQVECHRFDASKERLKCSEAERATVLLSGELDSLRRELSVKVTESHDSSIQNNRVIRLPNDIEELKSNKDYLSAFDTLQCCMKVDSGRCAFHIRVNILLPEILCKIKDLSTPEFARKVYDFFPLSVLESIISPADYRAYGQHIEILRSGINIGACTLCQRFAETSTSCVLSNYHIECKQACSDLRQLNLRKNDVLYDFWNAKMRHGIKSSKNSVVSMFSEPKALLLIRNHALQRNSSVVSGEMMHLMSLEEKHVQITDALEVLEEDIKSSGEFILQLHEITYERVCARCRAYFADLVPGKNIDIIYAGQIIDDGLKFVITDKFSNALRSIEELSGGQKSLLSLSYVFACALNRSCPLYLMDEIDAALDEENQETIANIIETLFRDKTIFCVSHHPDFQAHAAERLSAKLVHGKTVISLHS